MYLIVICPHLYAIGDEITSIETQSMPLALSAIYSYPVKSCAALALHSANVEKRGLQHDRRWMIVDEQGKFLTGRQFPKLTLLRAEPQHDNSLKVTAPGMSSLLLEQPQQETERITIIIWKDVCEALHSNVAADEWISTYLGRFCRWVYMDSSCRRPIDSRYSCSTDEVSFADGYPLLLISQASLDLLNEKLKHPINMLRFRPNLVVSGTTPHEEDQWEHIRIGAIEFDIVKACTRCVFTTVDPANGEFAPDGEPLKTLLTYRRGVRGITFGQNLIPRRLGTLKTGEIVQVV